MENKLSLKIGYLYPRSMNIYGDRGNVIALSKRCQWHNIKCQVDEIEVGEVFRPNCYDIVFAGGGQDIHQQRIAQDLQDKKSAITEEVEKGTVFLLICGTYQMFGHYFLTSEGTEIPGISVFDCFTKASNVRKIGNVIVSVDFLDKAFSNTLVGFENHSGNTYIKTQNSKVKSQNDYNKQTVPLGTVLSGFGNNGEDKTEGARYKNCFGTYLHGSLLPKNPHFADYLISLALKNKYQEPIQLMKLDDNPEQKAHQFILDNRANE